MQDLAWMSNIFYIASHLDSSTSHNLNHKISRFFIQSHSKEKKKEDQRLKIILKLKAKAKTLKPQSF